MYNNQCNLSMRRASVTVEERKELRLFKEAEYIVLITRIFTLRDLSGWWCPYKSLFLSFFSFKEHSILYYMEVLLKFVSTQKTLCSWRTLKIKEVELHP